jgi:hypothetical protein
MELPPPLMMMMGTLLSKYDIKNWSIYSNNRQNTCVVIRFTDMDGCTQPTHYRRISDKQLARSKARSVLHKQSMDQGKQALDTNKNKKRRLDNINDDSPELPRVESSPYLQCECIDSPILPVKEAHLDSPILTVKEARLDSPVLTVKETHLTNSVNMDTEYGSTDSPLCRLDLPLVSPVTSHLLTLDNFMNSPSNSVTGNSPIQPALKMDASTEMEYVTQSISTQVECFQRNHSTQCGAKNKFKSTQTMRVTCSDESIQVAPEPVMCTDSSVQHQASLSDKCLQFGSGIFTYIDAFTQMSPTKPATLIHKHTAGIKGLKERKCVSAPRYNKTLGHPVDDCDTYCYLVGFKMFDEKGHSGHCYYRCANCETFICHVCKTDIYLYHWAKCCRSPELDGVLYSSSLTPQS